MTKVWFATLMEIKGMRIYKVQLFINLIVIPFSYAIVLLLAGAGEEHAFLLSGLMIASLVAVFFTLVALRVSNLMQADVLELYAVLPIHMTQAVLGIIAAYSLLALPQVIFLLALAAWQASEVQIGLLLIGTIVSLFAMASLGCFLGVVVRNPFKAQGIFPLLTWLTLLASPIYYGAQDLPRAYVMMLLINPTTHAVNLIRPYLGFPEIIDIRLSLVALIGIAALLGGYSFKALKDVRMLERWF
ncbi:ABC transporter permease [Dehalococcoidia bacterium]|nr:ABC transporter permease [Dehalococcoidia bacterium]